MCSTNLPEPPSLIPSLLRQVRACWSALMAHIAPLLDKEEGPFVEFMRVLTAESRKCPEQCTQAVLFECIAFCADYFERHYGIRFVFIRDTSEHLFPRDPTFKFDLSFTSVRIGPTMPVPWSKIVFMAEIKPDLSKKSADDDANVMVHDGTMELIDKQQSRIRTISVKSDGFTLQLVNWAGRSRKKTDLQRTRRFEFLAHPGAGEHPEPTDGFRALLRLLATPPADLGYLEPDGAKVALPAVTVSDLPAITLVMRLRDGGARKATVYQARMPQGGAEDDIVIKTYPAGTLQHVYQLEKGAMQKVSDVTALAPRLIAHDDESHTLVSSPLMDASLSDEAYSDTLFHAAAVAGATVLSLLHDGPNPRIHGDVTPDNILVRREDFVAHCVLNDYSCSVPFNVDDGVALQTFVGTSEFAAFDLVQLDCTDPHEMVYKPCHDVEGLFLSLLSFAAPQKLPWRKTVSPAALWHEKTVGMHRMHHSLETLRRDRPFAADVLRRVWEQRGQGYAGVLTWLRDLQLPESDRPDVFVCTAGRPTRFHKEQQAHGLRSCTLQVTARDAAERFIECPRCWPGCVVLVWWCVQAVTLLTAGCALLQLSDVDGWCLHAQLEPPLLQSSTNLLDLSRPTNLSCRVSVTWAAHGSSPLSILQSNAILSPRTVRLLSRTRTRWFHKCGDTSMQVRR